MSGSEKALAPLDETLETREPGALLLEAGALKPNASADDTEPRVVYVGEHTASGDTPGDEEKPVIDEAKVVAEMALTVPETDPEQLAYAMWNEGRADEAIALLERHLATEHARRRETALVPTAADGKDTIPAEPASDWRDRHRAALASGDFNAFGKSVHTIDITPTQADAVVPHSVRSSLRVGWLMGVCLAVLCVSAAGAYFVTREGGIERALTASEQVIADLTPALETPAVTPPDQETEIVATATDVDAADVPPPDNTAAADVSPPADEEIVDVPPEEDAPVEDVTSVPPEEDAADEATSTVSDDAFRTLVTLPQERSASRDDVASAPPVDASLLPSSADADATGAVATEGTAPDAVPPAEAAVLEPDVIDGQPTVEARLPRARPEPPASVVERASEPQVAALEDDPAIPDSELPLVVSEPPLTDTELPVASADSDVPVYGPDGPVRIYRHIRRIYPPIIRRTFSRRMLTPAEYQALVERRQLAERYTAERRSGIIGRVLTLP
jgi:hypothetical protein